jgi:hypothetical protein
LNVSNLVRKTNVFKSSAIGIQEETIMRDRYSKDSKPLKKIDKQKVEINSEFAAMTNALFAANMKCIEPT